MLQEQRTYPATSQQQQQRRYQPANNRVRIGNGQRMSVGSVSNSVGQASDVMTESTCDRRSQLGQSYYQEAKKTLTRALSSDESGNTMGALELYNKALCSIRSGLAGLRSSVGEVPAADSALHDLKAKMENLKDQIKARMEDLLEQEMESRRARCRETLSSSQTGVGRQSQCTSHAGCVTGSEAGSGVEDKAAADLMFHMDTGIGLFEVDKKDHVMKFDDVDAVSVFKYRHQIEGQPPAFLQCGGFIYPLIPGQSPVLKSGDKMYMFPDLRKEDGTSVGISLETASPADLAHLDQLLSQLADLKTTAEVTKMAASGRKEDRKVGVAVSNKAEPTCGTTVSGGIDKGVNWVSTQIAKGTEMAGNLVIKGASRLRERMEPEEKPAEVPVAVQKGMHYTRQATGCVVSVSDFLMTSLAKLTVKAGTGVKNMIQESEFVKGREVNPHAKEAWKVTKSGVRGAAGVFTDLKAAASAVVRTAGKESSRTVGHKYGPDAEKVADDAIVATGNTVGLVATYWSWKTWGITFLGKIGEVMSTENKEKENSTSQSTVKSSSS